MAVLEYPSKRAKKTAPESSLTYLSPRVVDLLNSVVEQNNLGVDYFQQENYSTAFRCFRQALVLFKTRFQELESHTDDADSSMDGPRSSSMIRPMSCSSACSALMPSASGCASSGEVEQEEEHTDSSGLLQSFVFHSSGIRLLPDLPEMLSIDPLQQDRLVSAIVVFNCGLVFQRQGQTTCSFAHLQRAYSLYQQAHKLLEDQIQTAGSAGNALVDFLCMAVLNNMGLLLRCDLMDYPESRKIFGQLVACAHAFQTTHPSLLDCENYTSSGGSGTSRNKETDTVMSTSTPSDRDEQESLLYLANQVDEFLLNAVALTCAEPNSAAAA